MTPVNESLGSSDSARSLRQELGDALYTAGDRLAESGGVLEVRVLQGGQIVTGIVGGDSASAASPESSKSASKSITGKYISNMDRSSIVVLNNAGCPRPVPRRAGLGKLVPCFGSQAELDEMFPLLGWDRAGAAAEADRFRKKSRSAARASAE